MSFWFPFQFTVSPLEWTVPVDATIVELQGNGIAVGTDPNGYDWSTFGTLNQVDQELIVAGNSLFPVQCNYPVKKGEKIYFSGQAGGAGFVRIELANDFSATQ